MMLSTGLFSLTLFVDRLFLFWYSNSSAAAAMSAGTVFWAMICVPCGLIGYTSTFVAQYVGAKRLDRGMRVVLQGLILAFAMGPLFLLAAIYIREFFEFFHEAELISLETEYFRWLAPGAWAMVLSAAMNGLFAGVGRTRTLLFCDFVATLVNILFDWLLIFGMYGFPEMGISGAALASSISLFAKVALLAWFVIRFWKEQKPSIEANEFTSRFAWLQVWDQELMMRLIRYGWPAGIQLLAESLSFTIIMLFVGQIGTDAMAATTLALGVNLIAFVPINGLGMAVGILVGQYLTAGKLEVAKRCVWTGLGIAVIYSSFFLILYGGFPDESVWIYSLGTEPDRFAAMKPLLKPLLYFIAGYCVIDAMQIVFVSAIKGAGDTHFVFIASVVIGVVVVGLGKFLGDYFHGGLYWWWGVITVWVMVMAVVFSARYFQGKWQKMRVIEQMES